jgi:hypothetical protein
MSTGNEFVDAINEEPAPVESEEIVQTQESSPEAASDPNELIKALEADKDSTAQDRDLFKYLLNETIGSQPKQRDLPEILKGKGPDDYLTAAEQKALFDYQQEQFESKLQADRADRSEEIAMQKYPDYETVVRELTFELVNKDPKLLEAINRSKNPAETAYRIGCSHPIYREYQSQQQVQAGQRKVTEVVDKVKRNLNTVPTLSGVTQKGVSDDDRIKRLQNMPRDEFMQLTKEGKLEEWLNGQ